ncbi:ABC transporter ATP-binding protein [Macrococcus equipercicus]|uniref:ABC transporter ATP-binding protein n=1 Tax=Macrococcus equipercicus TaxID=69967 RepID=A0A9Q9BN01_9STAP|nr:ABC transporter ATP-binding protein [Macrococcus equipercicus]KAA1037611.1 ABC transporter ATP-binding protein [Macrococcus equipercicus]UTH14120.1 ABC transporter ATP-binding protein [Macrococcus equipercicus]
MAEQIIINNVSKSFGNAQVLTGIDFDMDSGRIYGFIGPSGAGKTTLVRMIAGLDYPSAGSIYVLDKVVPDRSLMQHVGFMAQSDALYSELTGRENLAFYCSLYSLKKNVAKERIAYTAGLVGLENDLNKKVSQYSGGMKRRLSLAIALLHNPTIIILDEPTVGIDPELRRSIWEELAKLKAQGKTIIMTTHVMDEAERCDYIAMIKDGTILASGTPYHLKTQYHAASFDDVFIKAGRKQVPL